MKFLICQYCHIEGYPPSFNAINLLAQAGHEIILLFRKDIPSKWNYYSNIQINFVGNYNSRYEFEKTGKFHKIKEFLTFLRTFKRLVKKNRPDYILLYDNIPLMVYMFIRQFISKKIKIWYHNHDNHYLKDHKKYTLNYFAYFVEKKAFRHIDFFSLPQEERLRFFNLKKFKGEKFIIPNYPAKYIFNSFKQISEINDTIKMVYPGNINENLGLEDVIKILNEKVNGKTLTLSLIGDIRETTKNRFISLAKENNVEDKLFFRDRTFYVDMPQIISSFDIGLAMYKPVNLTYTEAGTAANKIYEYAACGLPVILLDTEHYRKHLDKFEWTFFTDLSRDSIISIINQIISNYEHISKIARADFENDLNFEKHFYSTVNNYIK